MDDFFMVFYCWFKDVPINKQTKYLGEYKSEYSRNEADPVTDTVAAPDLNDDNLDDPENKVK